MKNKIYPNFAEAVADIPNGASIMMHSFIGPAGIAQNLIAALKTHGAKNLTLITPNGGGRPRAEYDVGFKSFVSPSLLIENGQVKKLITAWTEGANLGAVEYIDLHPQGILAEKIRAGGAGLGGFYSPVGAGTLVQQAKEKRIIAGREYVLELPLKADYAFVRAYKSDELGNLVYRLTARSFNPLIATAATLCIVEVDEIVKKGELDPEEVITPGCFVDRIVKIK